MSDRVIHLHQPQLTSESDRHITDPAFAINENISLRHAAVIQVLPNAVWTLYVHKISKMKFRFINDKAPNPSSTTAMSD